MDELGERHWDLIIFTETWREQLCENWLTEHGHSWFGSGGTKKRNGVGFLLHCRWKHLSFRAVSDRVASLDIQFSRKLTI